MSSEQGQGNRKCVETHLAATFAGEDIVRIHGTIQIVVHGVGYEQGWGL